MTLYEFRALSEHQQAIEVWKGVFIEIRNDDKHSILLYDLGGFYVEVFYDPALNQIVRLMAFKSTNRLSPYLDQMSTEELDSLL